jgi:hypothetical protein
MSRYGWLCVIGLLAACLLSTVGTGGFTNVSADRQVDVSVVDDSNAYLRMPDGPLACGETAIVENQFEQRLDRVTFDVVIEGGELRVDHRDSEAYSLAPGESLTVELRPPADPNVTVAEKLHVEDIGAQGEGVVVSVDRRTFRVDCAG